MISGLCFLRLLSSVLAASLHALLNAAGVELAADNLITETDILNAAAAQENNGVLLEVVSHSRNVGSNFEAVRQTNAGDLSDS